MLKIKETMYSYKDKLIEETNTFFDQPLFILVFVSSIFINKVSYSLQDILSILKINLDYQSINQ